MLQAFALSVVGIVYFAWFLAHLTYLAHAPAGLGFVIYVVLATQFTDAVAFLFGKKIGRHRWTVISPNKTIEGSLFALATSIALAFLNSGVAFPQFDKPLREQLGHYPRTPDITLDVLRTIARWLVLGAMRAQFRVTRRGDVPSGERVALLANHQSHLDTLAVLAALPERRRRQV